MQNIALPLFFLPLSHSRHGQPDRKVTRDHPPQSKPRNPLFIVIRRESRSETPSIFRAMTAENHFARPCAETVALDSAGPGANRPCDFHAKLPAEGLSILKKARHRYTESSSNERCAPLGCCLSSACSSACQASVAHLTRSGNLRTPLSRLRSPRRLSGSISFSAVSMSWK